MYMPYVMCGYAATVGLMLVGCQLGSRSTHGLRGLRLMKWSMMWGLVAVILMAVRQVAPLWITILAANQGLFACFLLFYCAVADVLETPAGFVRAGVGLAAAGLGGDAWFTYIHPSLMARIMVSSGYCAIVAGVTAAMLFRHRDAEGETQRLATGISLQSLVRALGWMQIAMAALHAARCVVTAMFPPVSFVELDAIQAGFSYLDMLLIVGSGCGLIWLALCTQRQDLHALARTDGLTGLLNRRAFEEILTRELGRSNHTGDSLAVLLLDIDRFKEVNDSLGHAAGDEVIRRVSGVLRERLRPSDAVARYGGEEFAMLLRELNLQQAEAVAERLRADVEELDGLPGNLSITASLGVAARRTGDVPGGLLQRCDEALYAAKRGGRNLVTTQRETTGRDGSEPQLA